MILHIPHASRVVPEDVRDQIVLSAGDLDAELTWTTDAFTDELFFRPGATVVRFPISRLVVDVERFPDDADEPMSRVGMGMIYTRTVSRNRLRRILRPDETDHLVTQYYKPHHRKLSTAVQDELAQHGRALIVDCHSFPSQPLPCDEDQSMPRPDVCIGTDPFHTPAALVQLAARSFQEMGYNVNIDRPYTGSMVPMAFYKQDRRVASIMIEVNRALYMDELSGMKTGRFDTIQEQIQAVLGSIGEFQLQVASGIPGSWR
jgi:N-formylglutamate deformylase